MDYAYCYNSSWEPAASVLYPTTPAGSSCGHGRCKSCLAALLERGIEEGRVAGCFRCRERGCTGKFSFEQAIAALADRRNAEELENRLEDLLVLYQFVEARPAGQVLL